MVVTRFAPSPTGYLHIGGLRTALFNWLWARKNNGKFRLRIEDTDLSRNKKEAVDAIIKAFHWVNLNYDDEVVFQSERFDIYKKYINELLEKGLAYKCYLTKEELETIRNARMKGETPPIDIRKYRDFKGELDKPYVIRFKAPLEGKICFEDGVKGLQCVEAKEIDDFVIARSDGTPTYNFVVVIDDHEMGMTDIIRGDDHLRNTFKQILIYKAFGWDVPKFYHVPMIHNEKGGKMSKRDGAVDVMEYKREGYLPEALLNFLVRLGWSYGDQEIFSIEEMINLFDPKDINKAPSRFNKEKLDWLNSHYIKNSSNERIEKLLRDDFGVDIVNHDRKEILIDELKERVKTLKEMALEIEKILNAPSEYNEKAVKKFLKDEVLANLREFVVFLEDKNPKLPTDWHDVMHEFLEKKQIKPRELMPPLRIAMVGDTKGIDLAAMLSVLGQKEVIKRIGKLLASFEVF
ncbi:glutamyl-tRNA synthetase [Lebetimonas natsushimae]|uniref:Glutamate--tRNA ligase n=1 Tax=Lebetimonas natsushimae TaxID=1936991 RepID=A0A292YHK2_9BACT|nr:glutamate--tRNA ligase [Lebetimonas natsushimae]GAX88339.1 glutamyl-tRNA synthetase [Lebetimonas natsushimae]